MMIIKCDICQKKKETRLIEAYGVAIRICRDCARKVRDEQKENVPNNA